MVTASHNPKQDNGFKVYWGNGAQIIPPHDNGIANEILMNLVPWVERYDTQNVLSHNLLSVETESVSAAYFISISKLSSFVDSNPELNTDSPLKIAYTAMHGVGSQWIRKATATFKHKDLFFVSEQEHPDPEFSTVSFPNPEEKGVMILNKLILNPIKILFESILYY